MRNIKAGFLMAAAIVSVAVLSIAATTAEAQTDLNCGDPGTRHNMPVGPDDPHELDSNNDGIGCEDASKFGPDGNPTTTAPPVTTPAPEPAPTTAAPNPTPAPPPAEPVVAQPNFTG